MIRPLQIHHRNRPRLRQIPLDWTPNCNISLSPAEAIKFGNNCPVCRRKLTKGVEQRVEELADRPATTNAQTHPASNVCCHFRNHRCSTRHRFARHPSGMETLQPVNRTIRRRIQRPNRRTLEGMAQLLTPQSRRPSCRFARAPPKYAGLRRRLRPTLLGSIAPAQDQT